MVDPATLTAAVKAAAAVLSDEKTRKRAGWVIAAILSPILVPVVLICAMLSGSADHNNTALYLSWYGGDLSASIPAEYRGHIEEMRASFALLDSTIAEVDGQMEGGDSLDSTRVKAVFYALYFGEDSPGSRAHQAFVDCFVTYEERTREVDNGDGTTSTETYTVAVPIADLAEIYGRIGAAMGRPVTAEDQENAESVYNIIRCGVASGPAGSGSFEGADVPFIGADGFCSPIGGGWRGVVTSEFGNRIDPITGQRRGHTGMDLAVPTGTPIRAALPGTVTVSQYNAGGYGYYVMIDHGNGLSTLYGHNSKLLVRVGQTVEAGDIISLSGSTGRSTGPHLHFEVRVNGERTNPRHYLP